MRDLLIFASLAAAAREQASPAFEVASVKPATGPYADFRVLPGGRLHITGWTLGLILREAYSVDHYQITGGPAWLTTDLFDVEATSAGEPTQEQMMAMLRSLLADRFRIKAHREARTGNVFVMTVAKGEHKLKPPTGEMSFVRLALNDPISGRERTHYSLYGKKASLALIAANLAKQLGCPVIGRTGIEGEFDFKVDYAIGDELAAGPPLTTAVPEQLGLKLEAAKGPVETLVVDHAERPSAN